MHEGAGKKYPWDQPTRCVWSEIGLTELGIKKVWTVHCLFMRGQISVHCCWESKFYLLTMSWLHTTLIVLSIGSASRYLLIAADASSLLICLPNASYMNKSPFAYCWCTVSKIFRARGNNSNRIWPWKTETEISVKSTQNSSCFHCWNTKNSYVTCMLLNRLPFEVYLVLSLELSVIKRLTK